MVHLTVMKSARNILHWLVGHWQEAQQAPEGLTLILRVLPCL